MEILILIMPIRIIQTIKNITLVCSDCKKSIILIFVKIMDPYLSKQIITYMGNKRKLLHKIEEIVNILEEREGRRLSIGDGFSGSGIVSRLFKLHAKELYTNDIASYSETLNKCFLNELNLKETKDLEKYINIANDHADNKTKHLMKPFISKHWSPGNEIAKSDRVYFTKGNGERIDIYRNYIETIPKKYQPYLLAMLLIESSIHNNTNGQFSAYYKSGDIGHYGGKHEIDLQRITSHIKLSMPILSKNDCKVQISKSDTNEWVKHIPELDLVYYDPPYNKHPYCIFYFLLDIINNWDTKQEIPDTYRGQPLNWIKSKYNSLKYSKQVFNELIQNTNSKYILISYNNGGVIPLSELEKIFAKFGTFEKFPVQHKTYNRLKGLSEYKRTTNKESIQEYFWLLTKH